MATAYESEYVTLGGLILRSRAIDCYDWSDLLGTAGKRGDDFTVAGTAGVTARTRVTDAMRALLRVRINSAYDQDNNRIAVGSRRANLYTLLGVVRTVAEVNTTQTLTLTYPGGSASGDCIVVDGFWPEHRSPEVVEFTLDLRLPDGPLL